MRRKLKKLKPKRGLSHGLHLSFIVLLPLLVYVMVRLDVAQIALLFILLSKWRMLSVKPRHWPASLRANAVDIIVGLSVLAFMLQTDQQALQLMWSGLYALWLLVLKPRSGVLIVSTQALVAQFAGLTALFLQFGESHAAVLIVLSAAICYLSARHFLISFDEPLTRFLATMWAYFAAALVWILSHWLLFYGPIAQPTLIINLAGFSMMTMYYLYETDKLSVFFRKQIVFIAAAILVIILVFSDWGDKTI